MDESSVNLCIPMPAMLALHEDLSPSPCYMSHFYLVAGPRLPEEEFGSAMSGQVAHWLVVSDLGSLQPKSGLRM